MTHSAQFSTYGSRLRVKSQSNKSSDADLLLLVCDGLQPDLVYTLLVRLWYIGKTPTVHAIALSVWLCDATPHNVGSNSGFNALPTANQTGLNPWQLQNPQSVPAVLGPQETVQLTGYTTSTRSFARLARNGSTCPAPPSRRISCCHLSK